MKFNNLICRCGACNWSDSWTSDGSVWSYGIVCNSCGAIHYIGHSKDYHCKVIELFICDNPNAEDVK